MASPERSGAAMRAPPTISLAAYFNSVEMCCSENSGDLTGLEDRLRCGEDQALASLVSDVQVACEEVGFFVVVDHGIDPAMLARLRRESAAFFARPPQSVVVGMLPPHDQSRFAWLDFVPECSSVARSASPGSGTGRSSSSASAGGSWSLGPAANRGGMPWRIDSCEFEEIWRAYYTAIESLTVVMMRIFALVLRLPISTFDAALVDHGSAMRAILYPEVSEAEVSSTVERTVIRSGEHTDWGCVTVLLMDALVGGLEICKLDGSWEPITPIADGLVVNLGDLMPFWTGGKWLATRHRVVARQESRSARISIPFFGLVNRATVLSSLLNTYDGNEKPITAGEFFDRHADLMKERVESHGSNKLS